MRPIGGPATSPPRSAPLHRGRIRYAATALCTVTLLASVAVPSGAELVVFSSGHVLKTETFEVEGDTARMELPSGGALQVSLAVIQRVVANEVELTPEERRLPLLAPEVGGENGAEAVPGLELPPPDEHDAAAPDPARSISGRVLNEGGEPVEGLEVRARTMRLFQAVEGSDDEEQELQAASDGEGHYRFESLAEGEYRVSTLATDRYAPAMTVVRTGVDFANLVVGETRPLWVYGRAVNGQGEPLEGVRVVPRGQPESAVLTDYDGIYALAMKVAGRRRSHEVRFTLPGYREETLDLSRDQLAGHDEIRLDAVLEPLRSLAEVSGSVRTAEGEPVAGERIFLKGAASYYAATDAAGEFRIPEVMAGHAYRLSIRPHGPYRDHEQRVRVGVAGLDVDVVLEPLGYGTVSGRMISSDGTPVPHFSLWLESAADSSRRVPVTSDAAGRFSVSGVPTGPLSFATLANPRFTIDGPVLSPRRGEETVDLVLDWGSHEIRGRVVDSQGNPVAAPQVTLYWARYDNGVQSRAVRHTAVAADGSFRFTRLGPGAHTVTVHAAGFQSRQLEAESPGDLVVQLLGSDREEVSSGR